MQRKVRLRFRANVAYRVTRQAVDETGVVSEEPVAKPYFKGGDENVLES
jgi:hypothetical protein